MRSGTSTGLVEVALLLVLLVVVTVVVGLVLAPEIHAVRALTTL